MSNTTVATRPFEQWRLLFLALDPLHVGTGGMQLGSVDLAIAREPGTKLPKIPGTGLSGAARSYVASRFGQPNCAGQRDHCGRSDCPVCYAFGSLRTDDRGRQRATAGTVNLFDALILFFPVATASGPKWVSTVDRCTDAGFIVTAAQPDDDEVVLTGAAPSRGTLNLGWLLLRASGGTAVDRPDDSGIPDDQWDILSPRIALVSDKRFSQVVNSNLEKRTSVSIDPETGAAADKALFTYEAIPRATWLFSDVVEDDYRRGEKDRPFPMTVDGTTLNSPYDVAKAGLDQMRWLGIGGMGTRGFGRLWLLADWTVTA